MCKINQENIEVILACVGEGYLYSEASKFNIKVELFQAKSALNKELINYINENSIDIVNFHGAKAFFMYLFMEKKLKAVSAATVHSDFRYDFQNNKIKKIFYTPLSIWGLKKFDNYICVSECIEQLLEKEGFKGKKYIARNAIEITENLEENNDIRKLYNIKSEEFVFVIAARFHPVKNHIGLIEAFSDLKKEYCNVKLICVGEGENRELIESKINSLNLEKDIILPGFQNNIMDYFKAADISILTSFSEGGDPPLVILESALAKKPVICSNIGNLKNIITKDFGYLINPSSNRDIYLKMKEAYENRQELNKKGALFYDYIKSNFSIEIFNEKYREIFNDLLENRCV